MVKQKFKKFGEKVKQAKEFWDSSEDPQEGLVRIGNSPFYATPDEPADPMDCDRYPDSPFCGGNPLTNKPIDLSVSLVKDDCNLGIQFDGAIGFIKVPPAQIVYRNPDCPLPEPPEPEKPERSIKKTPIKIPPSKCLTPLYLMFRETFYAYGHSGGYKEDGTRQQGNIDSWGLTENHITLLSVKYPVEFEAGTGATIRFHVKYSATNGDRNGLDTSNGVIDAHEYSFQFNIYPNCHLTDPDVIYEYGGYAVYVGGTIERIRIGLGTFPMYENNFNTYLSYYDESGGTVKDFEYVYDDNLLPPITVNTPITSFVITDTGKRTETFYGVQTELNASYFIISEQQYTSLAICGNYPPPVLPPPPPKCMCCCPNVEQNDQLLRLILKKIGSEHLPALVPKVLTDRKKGTTKIESLAEFTAYTVKQMDALCGRYPIDIEIEDADLTKEGNQNKKIKLPNIAETLAEMMGLLLVLRSESDATLNATIRALTEAGSSKQMAFMAYEYAKANAEFLGYKGEQKERKMAFSFKPGEGRLDKMLQEGEISVKGWENEDKDDFNDHIAPLLELAAMWKLANFRKTGAQDPKASIKEFLTNAGAFSDSIDAEIFKDKVKKNDSKDAKEKDSEGLKDDWDKFTEEAEKGFITQPGITDNEKPYGRPLEQRPKIRDISTDTSETKDE